MNQQDTNPSNTGVHRCRFWEVSGCPVAMASISDTRYFWDHDAIAHVVADNDGEAIELAMEQLLSEFNADDIGGEFWVHAREVHAHEAQAFWSSEELEAA